MLQRTQKGQVIKHVYCLLGPKGKNKRNRPTTGISNDGGKVGAGRGRRAY